MIECIDCRKAHDDHKSFYRWMSAPGVPQPDRCPMPPPIQEAVGSVQWPSPQREIDIFNPFPLSMIDGSPPPPQQHGPICAECQQQWLDSLQRRTA